MRILPKILSEVKIVQYNNIIPPDPIRTERSGYAEYAEYLLFYTNCTLTVVPNLIPNLISGGSNESTTYHTLLQYVFFLPPKDLILSDPAFETSIVKKYLLKTEFGRYIKHQFSIGGKIVDIPSIFHNITLSKKTADVVTLDNPDVLLVSIGIPNIYVDEILQELAAVGMDVS